MCQLQKEDPGALLPLTECCRMKNQGAQERHRLEAFSNQLTNMLWSDFLEYNICVYCHTAHGNFELEGEVHKTVMLDKAAGISQFCEFDWYKWNKFRSTTISFPEDPLVIRTCIGHSIDVGPAMTIKILTPMEKVVHCTYCSLTPEELAGPVE